MPNKLENSRVEFEISGLITLSIYFVNNAKYEFMIMRIITIIEVM